MATGFGRNRWPSLIVRRHAGGGMMGDYGSLTDRPEKNNGRNEEQRGPAGAASALDFLARRFDAAPGSLYVLLPTGSRCYANPPPVTYKQASRSVARTTDRQAAVQRIKQSASPDCGRTWTLRVRPTKPTTCRERKKRRTPSSRRWDCHRLRSCTAAMVCNPGGCSTSRG